LCLRASFFKILSFQADSRLRHLELTRRIGIICSGDSDQLMYGTNLLITKISRSADKSSPASASATICYVGEIKELDLQPGPDVLPAFAGLTDARSRLQFGALCGSDFTYYADVSASTKNPLLRTYTTKSISVALAEAGGSMRKVLDKLVSIRGPELAALVDKGVCSQLYQPVGGGSCTASARAGTASLPDRWQLAAL
jgi:hypothetical protein